MTQAVVYRPHPGPACSPRRLSAAGAATNSYWVDLGRDVELFEACQSIAQQFEGDAVLFRFSAVELSSAALHFVEDGVDGRMVRYGKPLQFATPTLLVAGHMTVGWDAGRPLPHAHGYVATEDGRVLGGHLAPGQCVLAAGRNRVEAHLTVLSGCSLQPLTDEETGFRLLSPFARRAH